MNKKLAVMTQNRKFNNRIDSMSIFTIFFVSAVVLLAVKAEHLVRDLVDG